MFGLRWNTCRLCHGVKFLIDKPLPCPKCRATGQVRVPRHQSHDCCVVECGAGVVFVAGMRSSSRSASTVKLTFDLCILSSSLLIYVADFASHRRAVSIVIASVSCSAYRPKLSAKSRRLEGWGGCSPRRATYATDSATSGGLTAAASSATSLLFCPSYSASASTAAASGEC